MFLFVFIFFSFKTFSIVPAYWNSLLRIEDRHEFYKENQVIQKPIETWQLLFSVVYPSSDLSLLKDCVFYYVPKKDEGVLKITSIQEEEKCEAYLFENGHLVHQEIRSLQFTLNPEISLFLTKKDFKTFQWRVSKSKRSVLVEPKSFLSSAEFQAGKFILLSPKRGSQKEKILKKKNEICHKISDDCSEISPPDCELCENGWYEIPNGCIRSPKYCGIHFCGQKDRPACSKGTAYLSTKVDCSVDTSFVYCQEGLRITCEGGKAFCR